MTGKHEQLYSEIELLFGQEQLGTTLAQFFKQKSSRANQQVCRPGAEQADKFMF
jgi:hypothetical protein